jgi:hypothetical protein
VRDVRRVVVLEVSEAAEREIALFNIKEKTNLYHVNYDGFGR